VDGHIVVAGALVGPERHLMRPFPIYRAFAQLTFAVDHSTTVKLVAARAHATCRGRRGSVRGAAGGVGWVYQARNKKGTFILLCTATKVLLQRKTSRAMKHVLTI
jgi:hypothetical protein